MLDLLVSKQCYFTSVYLTKLLFYHCPKTNLTSNSACLNLTCRYSSGDSDDDKDLYDERDQ